MKTNKKLLFAALLSACVLFAGCKENTDPYEGINDQSDAAVQTDAQGSGDTSSDEKAPAVLSIGYSASAAAQSGRICPDGKGGIYYRDAASGFLSHAKADGSGKTELAKLSPLFINLVGDKLFFIAENAENTLCSLPISGGEAAVLSQNDCKALFAIGDKLYYSDAYALYVMNTDGNGDHKLIDSATPVGYRDGKLYYLDSNRFLNTYDLSNGEKALLLQEPASTVTVTESGVFFLNTQTGIFGQLKDDGNVLPLISGMSLYMTDGNTLYFKEAVSGAYYQMSIETSEAKAIGAFSRLFFTSDGIPKKAEEIDLANAGAVYSEDGNYLYLADGQVFVYATLGESMKASGKAECLTVYKDGAFKIW